MDHLNENEVESPLTSLADELRVDSPLTSLADELSDGEIDLDGDKELSDGEFDLAWDNKESSDGEIDLEGDEELSDGGFDLASDNKSSAGESSENAITADLNKRKDQRKLEKAEFKNGGPPPSTEPILARNPTSAEMDAAISVVTDPKKFRLYDNGHVCVFNKKLTKDKQQTVVADIVFTDLKDISADKRRDLDWFLAFLEESKMFVYAVGSESRSCGGFMWAIGWRKSSTRLEIVGHYVNSKAIKENLEEWKQHMQDANRANKILWDLFQPIGKLLSSETVDS
ncbi:hypothetical protein PtA15_11A340 [Puccinia triticina]|uniref:Tet-like 2OG-Fe(II) oxygenase domain-containing protein n=1 Tax=Puccinia triticina TaxID=208348 RepID=A0ABY7CXI4_9BASI|nr:uncharacterized protein PtA15_11A340 [Puccinia triticina]WAQ89650.1 hypothetical protein PtA15_11A340 [Puccinia triticina]